MKSSSVYRHTHTYRLKGTEGSVPSLLDHQVRVTLPACLGVYLAHGGAVPWRSWQAVHPSLPSPPRQIQSPLAAVGHGSVGHCGGGEGCGWTLGGVSAGIYSVILPITIDFITIIII